MLEQLVKYAQEHAKRGNLQFEPGFAVRRVKWALQMDPEQGSASVIEIGDPDQKKNRGKEFTSCPDLTQPELKRLGAGARHFLADTTEVIVLLSKKPDDPKLVAKHEYFVSLLEQAAEAMPVLGQIAKQLRDGETLLELRERLEEKKAKPTDKATFRVNGGYPLESQEWHNWWRSFRGQIATSGDASEEAVDLVSGETVEPAPTHPKITGLTDVGGLAMGDVLISFKQPSFRSYGLMQSANAALSEETAYAYAGALNHLIEHSERLSHSRVVCWFADRQGEPLDLPDPLRVLHSGSFGSLGDSDFIENFEDDEDHSMPPQAKNFLRSPRTGGGYDLSQARFYGLTLSGAGGRVMIRDWMEGRFEDLARAVEAWFSDLQVVHRHNRGLSKRPKFNAILGSLFDDLDRVPASFETSLWRVALLGQRMPESAAARALQKVKAAVLKDDPVRHEPLGLLKAFLIRKREGDSSMTPKVNPDHPDSAYQCGRLMAVLADLQQRAIPGVGAGVVQRFYPAASATPKLVMGRLIRLSHFHLDKFSAENEGLRRWFEKRIAEIMVRIGDDFPDSLDLPKQSLFALGYYQEKANRGRKTETEDSSNEEE